jgi:hypothetical protein
VRWDRLFDDLHAQVDASRRAEVWSQSADLGRAHRAEITLIRRCLAAGAARLTITTPGGDITGTCCRAADHWLLLRAEHGDVLIPMHAVRSVRGLPHAAAPPQGRVAGSLTLSHIFRQLCRDRLPVAVHLGPDEAHGTIDAVGRDHLDLAEHPIDELRRADSVRAITAVPFSAVSAVRVLDTGW